MRCKVRRFWYMLQEVRYLLQILSLNRGLLVDFPEAMEKFAPVSEDYHHDETWHDGNGYAHIRASVVGTSTTIPVLDGVLQLGTWQQIVLIDFDNKPRNRNITVQIIY